jgi:predicted peptidase
MGGWASYLLPILYPDRFAASLPYAGVPTQGLWVGCEFDPCFQGTNGGNAKDQWTNPLLDNLRNVPIAISHGVEDELVPVTGAIRQAEKLTKLGYRNRCTCSRRTSTSATRSTTSGPRARATPRSSPARRTRPASPTSGRCRSSGPSRPARTRASPSAGCRSTSTRRTG